MLRDCASWGGKAVEYCCLQMEIPVDCHYLPEFRLGLDAILNLEGPPTSFLYFSVKTKEAPFAQHPRRISRSFWLPDWPKA